MLIAILTFLFLGGSSSVALDYLGDARGNAKDVIAHDARRDSAVDTIKAMEKMTKDFEKQRKKNARALVKAWKRYEDDYDAIDAVWQTQFDAVDEYYGGLIDKREDLKQSVTREEWSRIFPPE